MAGVGPDFVPGLAGGVSAEPETGRRTVLVCRSSGCQSSRSKQLQAEMEEELGRLGLADSVIVKPTGCHGFCQQGPVMVVEPEGILYCKIKPGDAAEIARSHLQGGRPVERLFFHDPRSGVAIPRRQDIPFLARQQRVVLRHAGKINPEQIDDYLAAGGYQALGKVLREMAPSQVIEEVKQAGLRGRGGAGFPTGRKWEIAAEQPASPKYFICNGNESDPGAYLDRSTMEADPHTVLEGLIIGAYAVGATQAYIYVCVDYTLAEERMRLAVRQAEERGFLGENIRGSGFNLRVDVVQSVGAFLGGQETAVIAAIEGRRGMPSGRPPYPAVAGLWGQPTIVNNVETLASVPVIIERGAGWYSAIGTAQSKGTKVFALGGRVAIGGLVEVPLGTPLSEIVFDIGGGIAAGRQFKAVQIGGPLSSCLTGAHLDLPVDYESLAAAGGVMGSGSVVVFDDTTCMVDQSLFYLSFTQGESCGKCVPCRLGTRRLLDIVEDIANGRARLEDLSRLEELAETTSLASLCALGGGAANPVIGALKYFRQEFEDHIKYHHCEAAVCKGLVKAPCAHTCPAGIDIPRYLRLIQAGRYADAVACIREANPLPSICGRVCFHRCETRCRRAQMDEAVAINALKRFATEQTGAYPKVEVAPPTGKRVAVVGSGPAGLAAAHYLARWGHAVTIFEALPVTGGMLRVGIPRYRLPDDVLDAEVAEVARLGVEIKVNQRLESAEALLAQGFDAVLLSTGAHFGTRLGVEGEDGPGVMEAARFLRELRLGLPVRVGKRVVVVGGGNSAIDACRTSLRLGAQEVTLVYRRTREEMPAADIEVEEARHEGVKLIFLAAPTRIVSRDGQVEVHCQRMRPGSVEPSGRRRPEPVPGDLFVLEADNVIAAIGQVADVPREMGVKLTRRGTVATDPDSLATSRTGVFAAGDVVTGPTSVVQAIAAGKRAASAVDRFLGGKGDLEPRQRVPDVVPPLDEAAGDRRRAAMPCVAVAARVSVFDEVELGLTEEMALAEAARCLRCDLEERE